jgi:hypothetical protein
MSQPSRFFAVRIAAMTVQTSTLELLVKHGYKLIDDAWSFNRRLTYQHNDEANKPFISSLAKSLRSAGWEAHPSRLRAFSHPMVANYVIEIEPGGAETSGHFLHYVKAN